MADNISITAGTGTTIATDDCTTGHVQLMKVAYGADGDRTQVGADANGLDVDVTRLPAGVPTALGRSLPTAAMPCVEQESPTYSAVCGPFVPPASATDIATLYGSASKTIRITRIVISATQTTGAVRDVLLIKRSATNTAGTSAAATRVPNDANDAAATATVLQYTANPSGLGASVGTIRAEKAFIPATTAVPSRIEWDFTRLGSRPIVLRGVAQGIAVNLNAVTSAGNSVNVVFEWTEE